MRPLLGVIAFVFAVSAGAYTVDATYRGVAKYSSKSVDATGQRVLDFRW
jgi:hypothetical protein